MKLKSEKYKGHEIRFFRHTAGFLVRAFSGEINKYDGKHKYYADGANKKEAFMDFKRKYKILRY